MSAAKSLPAGWKWPWQYEFAPFFTLQPNSDTRAKQLEAWVDLVLAYFKASRSYLLEVNEASSSPLFYNADINRRLSPEAIATVLEALEARGNAEWQDKQKTRCLVMWRSPQEWGKLIHEWAQTNGYGNSVCTLYEIHSGEDSTSDEFHGMEIWMVKKAIYALAKEGRAEYIPGTNPDDSDAGVKFFS